MIELRNGRQFGSMINSICIPDLQLATLGRARARLSGGFSGQVPASVPNITISANQATGTADPTDLLAAATTLVVNLVKELASERSSNRSQIVDALWLQVRVDDVGRE